MTIYATIDLATYSEFFRLENEPPFAWPPPPQLRALRAHSYATEILLSRAVSINISIVPALLLLFQTYLFVDYKGANHVLCTLKYNFCLGYIKARRASCFSVETCLRIERSMAIAKQRY